MLHVCVLIFNCPHIAGSTVIQKILENGYKIVVLMNIHTQLTFKCLIVCGLNVRILSCMMMYITNIHYSVLSRTLIVLNTDC